MLKQVAGTTAPLHCILTQSIFSKLGSAPKICFKWASDDGQPPTQDDLATLPKFELKSYQIHPIYQEIIEGKWTDPKSNKNPYQPTCRYGPWGRYAEDWMDDCKKERVTAVGAKVQCEHKQD